MELSMLDIKTSLQNNDGINYKCGAHALEAVLRFYGFEKTIDEIWNSVSSDRRNGEKYTLTKDLSIYANTLELMSTIYKSKDICSTLDILDELNCPAIVCMAHRKPGNIVGHFVVFKGKSNGKYFFADPEKNSTRVLSPYQLIDFCKNTGPEVTGNIIIAFDEVAKEKVCKQCSTKYPLVAYQELKDSVMYSICPHCDRENIR